tara:strand:+ start:5682 stop:6086 length:405 start_codon:yes stop_codon:yes gene_type:complete
MLRCLREWGCAVACGLFLVSCAVGAEHTKDKLATVKKRVDEKKAVLVDVREKSEWDAGHVEGAVILPLSELWKGITEKELAKRLPQKKILYTHCAVGVRSRTAADILLKYKLDVRALKPGYKDLIAAGFKKAKE